MLRRLEGEIDLKRKQLTTLRIDATSLEAVKQLKGLLAEMLLTLCMLGKKFGRRYFEIFFICSPENRILHLMQIDLFHIVVPMRQTVPVSLESALSQRDYNRGGNLQYAAY